MTTLASTPALRHASETKEQRIIRERMRTAWHNGGPTTAAPRGNGRYVVTGRDGTSRYTVHLVTRDFATCDCPAGLHSRLCWHAAAAFLRYVADTTPIACDSAPSHVTALTGPISTTEAALIRSLDGTGRTWIDYDRSQAGLSELLNCDGCQAGLAERAVEDADPDGASYSPVNGSSRDGEDWLCAGCTAARNASGVA